MKKKFSKSKKIYLRRQKSRIRREVLDSKKREEEIKKIYEN